MGKNEKEINLAEELANATEQANIEEAEDFHEEESLEDHADFEDLADEPEDEIIEDDEPFTFNFNPKVMAMRWVKTFNIFQKRIIKPVYRKKILNPEDKEQIKNWNRAKQIDPEAKIQDVLNVDDGTFDRFSAFMDAVEDLPLTEEEMQDIAEPLAIVIEKHKKMQLSPEWSLVMAVVMIMIPRLDPLLPDNIMSIFYKSKAE